MSGDYPPFLPWGNFKSNDENNPDIISCIIFDEDTFETEYGICINIDINNEIRAINLYNFDSANRQLLNLWNEASQKGKIKKGQKFKIITWLGTSKRNRDRQIRRFNLVFR